MLVVLVLVLDRAAESSKSRSSGGVLVVLVVGVIGGNEIESDEGTMTGDS